MLYLPWAAKGRSISFIDALFMSASAVCVTGLTVLEIGRDFSLAGQIVMLVLFQIGGLGIVTFSVVLFGLMGRGISFQGRDIVQSSFLHTPRRDFFKIIKWVLMLTFVMEALGTIVLFLRFSQDFDIGQAFFLALFHAVSAFNNCGYSLFSNSLMDYQSDLTVNLAVMLLIILGGIGFIVQYEVFAMLRGLQKKLSLHSKIVLLITASLILIGTISFYLLEMNHTLSGVPFITQIMTSFFQSITSRTCGFNTVDIGQLSNATILLLIVLMFIGASPGSTGGGIKTTSFALLLLMIWNRFKGQEEVNVFNRTIPGENLTRTVAIIIAAIFSIFFVTTVLMFSGSDISMTPAESRRFFIEYLFETVSAFGTVGLSMGVTANINDTQKLAIIFMMFAGRLGPLTLAFSWYSSKRSIKYAEESIMVG